MIDRLSRRDFLTAAVAAGTAVPAAASLLPASVLAAEPRSAIEKLNLAVIGVGGRGASNLAGVASQNIVALCDIDANRLTDASGKHPQAQTYYDYRRIFDLKNLDGVVISTPDHMHAIPISLALKQGLAVYCEKPLTHTVYEAHHVRKLTAESNCVTQMGNQIHNHPKNNYRRVVEIIKAGVIGPVRRVHVWMPGVAHFVVGKRPATAEPPKGISYDMWVGPAPYRPYHKSHFHFNWRYWWDFGGGQLADFVCHYVDLPVWALDLKAPISVEAKGEKGHDGDNDVPKSMKVDYHFPARGDLPPVHLTWYHGGPMPAGAEEYKKGAGVLFEGTEGRLLADYTSRQLFMQQGKEARPVKPTIPDSIGHHREWIEAIKTGNTKTTCNFVYGSQLAEIGLLGNVSYRAGQKKLEWDGANMRVTNHTDANQFLHFEYRRGWSL